MGVGFLRLVGLVTLLRSIQQIGQQRLWAVRDKRCIKYISTS